MLRKRHDGGLFGFTTVDTMAIWPHVLFAGLYTYHQDAFVKYILGGGPAKVGEFWAKMPPGE